MAMLQEVSVSMFYECRDKDIKGGNFAPSPAKDLVALLNLSI
jgi:hypothetical protein